MSASLFWFQPSEPFRGAFVPGPLDLRDICSTNEVISLKPTAFVSAPQANGFSFAFPARPILQSHCEVALIARQDTGYFDAIIKRREDRR